MKNRDERFDLVEEDVVGSASGVDGQGRIVEFGHG